MTKQQKYPTDLTDEQIEFIKQFLPASSRFGRPRLEIAQVLNALFYVVVGGIARANVAKRLSSLEVGLSLFLEMAVERRLGENLQCFAPVGTCPTGAQKRGERGQS